RAWCSLASPCTTLMRSNTTRRSAPITRSRLRRPTSKSITTTLCPLRAKAPPKAAVEVVLPTPPLPDVTTKTWDILLNLSAASIQRRDPQGRAVKPGLHGATAECGLDVVGGAVQAVDRQQLGLEATAENAG